MAKNKTYTGNRQSVGMPTLNKSSYFQLIRMIRKEKEVAESNRDKKHSVSEAS